MFYVGHPVINENRVFSPIECKQTVSLKRIFKFIRIKQFTEVKVKSFVHNDFLKLAKSTEKMELSRENLRLIIYYDFRVGQRFIRENDLGSNLIQVQSSAKDPAWVPYVCSKNIRDINKN